MISGQAPAIRNLTSLYVSAEQYREANETLTELLAISGVRPLGDVPTDSKLISLFRTR